MNKSKLLLPSSAVIKKHILASLKRYWPHDTDSILDLPIHVESKFEIKLPLCLAAIKLPDWASHCGVNGEILIPLGACPENKDWRHVDWWLVSFLFLEGWHERIWEDRFGPIHSYSLRLTGWDDRAWQYAWVNRIALFLRCWAAHENSIVESELFGPLPKYEVLMTHDVDAIKKTAPIRLKQGIFNLFNAFRATKNGEFHLASERIKSALRFFFGREDWWMLDELLELEIEANISARYHFYSKSDAKNLKQWLFDPGYDVAQKKLHNFIARLIKSGGQVGLHTSFDSWASSDAMGRQKIYLQSIVKTPIISCRQHWLRFSWAHTWVAQAKAGIDEDTTLMFNDRPGFRNSTAIKWSPWGCGSECMYSNEALPTVMMDSHFYDYGLMTQDERREHMSHWLNECRSVSGQVAVLWHPHTLTKDYGWSHGLHELISLLKKDSK